MALGRFLMRLLLVPLGGCIAICVAMVFVLMAHFNRIDALPADDAGGLMAFVFIAPMMALSVAFMLFPACLAVLIAEAFAIRSWMYYAATGGLSSWISLVTVGALDKTYDLSDEPLIAVGAGIVAGFAYWIVAGWSAGFWKPVFDRPSAPPP